MKGLKHTKALLVLLGALGSLLAGCAAGNVKFERPAESDLVLGVTTKGAVIGLLGSPANETRLVTNGTQLEVLTYSYIHTEHAPPVQGDAPVRALMLAFHDGKLVSKSFSSTFASESTEFDPAQAALIHRGMTASAVRSLVGTPTGAKIYPATDGPSDTAWTYWFLAVKGSTTTQQTLIVDFNAQGLVTELVFREIK